MKKILVVAPQYVGDTILVIPFLRELRKNFSESTIDVVTKNAGKLVLSECPFIDNIYSKEDLQPNFYDKAYVLKRSLSAGLLVKKLKIKDTIGFGGQFREFILKKCIKYKPHEKHELEHFSDVLIADGIEVTDETLEYWTKDEDVQNVQKYFEEGKKKALIVTQSSTYVKNWTVEGFQDVINFLNDNNFECFIVGTEKEKSYNEQFKNVKNLCGELNFNEISALINQMDLIFGIDSGFCHMGTAFNKKVVALFGSTSLTQWGLRGENSHTLSLNLKCSPCRKAKKCKNHFKCMKDFSSEFVINYLKNEVI